MKNFILIILLCFSLGCKEKLDLKPNTDIVLPKTAQELESLLENSSLINVTPEFSQISADEYFVPTLADWQAASSSSARNAAIWADEIYEGETQNSNWVTPYKAIFYANSVLDILNKQDLSNDEEKRRVQGRALFIRSYSFYSLVSVFSKAYDESTAEKDLGIPLKLTGNVEDVFQRSTLKETYKQIISDAMNSAELLNQDISVQKRNSPSKVAAFSLLARVYLSMRKYDLAEEYCTKALNLYSKLTDFNTLVDNGFSAFDYNSEETIYYTQLIGQGGSFYNQAYGTYGVDPNLIDLYDTHDLRLNLYFAKDVLGNYKIRPINSASEFPFTGLATDELYLIKAECLARRNEVSASLGFLNQLCTKRWNSNASVPAKPYINFTASTPEGALELILSERRKALVFRSVRWTDLKRFNIEGRNVTRTRKLDNIIYRLEPNSSKYILPIPDDEIILSGILQNPR